MLVPLGITCFLVLSLTYVGYPLLIGGLAHLWPRRPRVDRFHQPRVTVCVPAFNVDAYLAEKLDNLLNQDYPQELLDILVYSDGSTDATLRICRDFAAANPRIKCIESAERRGKPEGVNRMAEEARGEVLVLTDSRQPTSANAVRELVSHLADPDVGCATGNLVLVGQAGSGFYWRYENWIRRQEGAFRGIPGMTGPLAAVRRIDFHKLPANIILDDVWLPMILARAGKRTVLAEKAVAYDSAFEDMREFGRKTRTLAGNYQLLANLPWVLVPWSNPLWLEFMLHKVLRLLSPWALIVLLNASIAGAIGYGSGDVRWWIPVLVTQLLFYSAAMGPRRWAVSRLSRTFIVLNAAALVGLARYLRGRQAVTW